MLLQLVGSKGESIPPKPSMGRTLLPAKLREKLRHLGRGINWGARVLTSPFRLTPDFIIIGAQRGGVSTAYQYLIQHPCVAPIFEQEVHFFDFNFTKNLLWYRSHFPSVLTKYHVKRTTHQDMLSGEGSAYYLFHPLVPRRVLRRLPTVKLIVLLRNPVDRAYAHYCQKVKQGIEHLRSFEEAIENEEGRLKGEVDRILENESYFSFNHAMYSYLSRGIYVDQLKNWMDVFPREQILIIRSEDLLFEDPQAALKRLLQFLELPDWEPRHYWKVDTRDHASSLNPATRQRLLLHFEPHNRRLYQFLDVNYHWEK
jgi:hypothetical protein